MSLKKQFKNNLKFQIMELQKFGSDLQELNFEQASEINGGQSLWYRIGYAIGATGAWLERLDASLDGSANGAN
jgi:hypothetical protein